MEALGGIVSDREHLEGGRSLWEALLKIARTNPHYTLLLGVLSKGEVLGDAASLPLEEIWSQDDELIEKVLILSPRKERAWSLDAADGRDSCENFKTPGSTFKTSGPAS